MKEMLFSEFLDKIYYGYELEFVRNDKDGIIYFIQGFRNCSKYVLTVDWWLDINDDEPQPQHDYLLNIQCDSMQERFAIFERAAIFDGKTIYDINNKIEVLYG